MAVSSFNAANISVRQWVCPTVLLIFGLVAASIVAWRVRGVSGQLQAPHLSSERLGAQRSVRGIHLKTHTINNYSGK